MKKVIKPLRLTIIIVFCLLIITCYFTKKEKKKQRIISVKTSKIVTESYSSPIHTAGILSMKKTIKLSFKTGGIIEAINFDEGVIVKKGQILAKLDMSEIDANFYKAKVAFEKAERDFKRTEKLYNEKAATLEQYQNAKTGYNIAKSNLEVAKFNKKHSIIKAPSNGKILKKFFEQGEMISPGIPVYLFASTEKNCVMRVSLTDKDIVKIKLGDKAEISFDAYPDKKFVSSVSEIAETADTVTGTFEVELRLDTDCHDLKSGFIGKVLIYPSEKEKLQFIPIEALSSANGLTGTVYTIDKKSNTAKKVSIKIKEILDDKLAVYSGLENYSVVVTEGVSYLSNNSKIVIE